MITTMRDTPGPPVPVTALLATHPFVARFDDELSLTPGESVIGIRREAGWWHGQNVAGKRGIFPENFVEHAPAPPPPPTAPPSHAGDRARTFGDSTPALSHSAMASFRTAPSSAFEGSTSSSLKRELFEPASRTAAPPTPGAAIGTAALEAPRPVAPAAVTVASVASLLCPVFQCQEMYYFLQQNQGSSKFQPDNMIIQLMSLLI